MTNKTLLTQEGYDKLLAELGALKDKKNHLITQIEEVAQPDESGEDGLATQLKDELELIDDKIADIEEAVEMSQIITKSKDGKVSLGSKVKIVVSSGKEKEFSIVDEIEADPMQNKISNVSPLGIALLGKKINDEVTVDAPVGKITYKIVSIV